MQAPRHVEGTVLAVEEHPLPYYTLSLAVPPALAATHPGQFVMVQVGDRLEPYLRRAFSVFDVSRANGSARLDLLGKIVGCGTRFLAAQRPGDRLPLLGPLGRGFTLPTSGRVAVVAGGVGAAGLLLLARALVERGVTFDFFYGGRSALDLACHQLFATLAAATDGELVASTEDGSQGEGGLITAPLARGFAAGRYQHVYCCGPLGLMAKVAELAAEHGVPGEASLEAPMGCGFGACLGCVVPHVSGRYALCCNEGPVFALNEVRW